MFRSMFRSIARIFVISAVCLIVVVIGGVALAGARGSDLATLAAGNPGAMFSQNGSDPASPTATNPSATDSNAASATGAPANSSASQDADNENNENEAASSGDESSEAGEQSHDQVQEQEVVGTVAHVDAANATFTVTTASGAVTFAVSNQTQYEDGLNVLSSLRQGMNVKVDSAPQAPGRLLAVSVKSTDDSHAPENSNSSGSESDGH